jgi:hypothetical protein
MPPKRKTRSTISSGTAKHDHGTRSRAKQSKSGKKSPSEMLDKASNEDVPKLSEKKSNAVEFEYTVPPLPTKDGNVVTPEKSAWNKPYNQGGFSVVIPHDKSILAFVLYTDDDDCLDKFSKVTPNFDVKWVACDDKATAEREATRINLPKLLEVARENNVPAADASTAAGLPDQNGLPKELACLKEGEKQLIQMVSPAVAAPSGTAALNLPGDNLHAAVGAAGLAVGPAAGAASVSVPSPAAAAAAAVPVVATAMAAKAAGGSAAVPARPDAAAAAAAAAAVPVVATAMAAKAAGSGAVVPARPAPKTMEEKLAAMREAKGEAKSRGYVLKVLVFPILNGKHVVAVDLMERTNQQQYWQFKPTEVATAVAYGGLGELRLPHMEFFNSLMAGGFRAAPYGPNEARQNSKGWDTYIMYGIVTANVFQSNTGQIGTSIGRGIKAMFRDNNFKTFYIESIKISNPGLMKYFDKKDVALYKDLEEAPINVADKEGLNVLFLDNTIADIMKVLTGKESPSEWTQAEREYAFQNGVVPNSLHSII